MCACVHNLVVPSVVNVKLPNSSAAYVLYHPCHPIFAKTSHIHLKLNLAITHTLYILIPKLSPAIQYP
jgi:hypothetical protein